jgi:hypothetical protein
MEKALGVTVNQHFYLMLFFLPNGRKITIMTKLFNGKSLFQKSLRIKLELIRLDLSH